MEFVTDPWSHQRANIELLEKRIEPYYALLWDMGTGKTKQAADIIRLICFELDRVPKTLIVCPSVVLENWKREIELHTNIPVSVVQVVDGCTNAKGKPVKNPVKKYKILQALDQTKSIFIISTDTVDNKTGSVWQELKQQGFEALFIDEVHNFKAYKGKRTEAIHSFTHNRSLKWRYILTGTPILQNALDLWSQFYILNPQILGSNYFSFRARYFYDKNAGMPSHIHYPDWLPKDEAYFKKNGYDPEQDLNNLNKIIYQHASCVMKADVLDLPPITYQSLEIKMAKEQQRIYDEFKRDLVAFIKKPEKSKKELEESLLSIDLETFELPEMLKADLAIVKIIRLQQLICGIFSNTEGEITILDTNRIKVLKTLLEELTVNKENKIIIWTVFKPTYEIISKLCTELKVKHVFLNGLQDKNEKQAAIDSFNTDPEVRIIIANQAAGGTGCNLTAANYSVYYSRSFNLGHDLQSEARNYRGGQKRNVTRIDLITPDTIDERVLLRLSEKKKHAHDVLSRKEFNKKELVGLI